MRASKIALLAGISGLALQLAAPSAFATDMALKVKAPPAPPPTPAVWTWWLEGGAAGMGGGDPFIPNFNNPAFEVMPKRWGGQGAIGTDYKFAGSQWHVSADFRYTANRSNTTNNSETVFFFVPTPLAVTGANSASRKEHNWEADFMVGHDLGIGTNTQVKVGLRVADIWGQTTGVASWIQPVVSPPTQISNYQQTDKWLGFGPRAAIEGSVPLQAGWTFDYNAGVAGLWGKTTGTQAVTQSLVGPGVLLTCADCPTNITTSNSAGVFNADVQAGFAYAFSQNPKLSLNYRFEYFDHVLATYNAAGNGIRVNRYYQGPTLKLTVNY
jgi:hypothetical protein